MSKFKYGDMFKFIDQRTGELPSETLSFSFGIPANEPLIYIKQFGDTFMYASKAGQHTRDIKALQYCEKVQL